MKISAFWNIRYGESSTQVATLSRIGGELKEIFRKIEKTQNLPFSMVVYITFYENERLIRRDINNSFSKKENEIRLEINFRGRDYSKMYRVELRHKISRIVFDAIGASLKKEKINVVDIERFISSLRQEMNSKGWLEKEVDYSRLEDDEF